MKKTDLGQALQQSSGQATVAKQANGLGNGREFDGIVVSTPAGLTVKVAITRLFRHPFYGKILKRTRNFLCHIEGIELAVGDNVRIKETKPISKNKHFVVIKKN